MSEYSLVLSDELLKAYFEFKQGKLNNPRMIERLLNYYHSPHLTNVNQLQRINEGQDLLPQLAAQGFNAQTLKNLANQTYYKLILNTENSDYPYVNIHNDKVEKNFSLTFRQGENRDKAIQLIKALCSEVKFILIFDYYFCDRWNNTQELFKQIIPKNKLTLLHDGHLTSATHLTRDTQYSDIMRRCGFSRTVQINLHLHYELCPVLSW